MVILEDVVQESSSSPLTTYDHEYDVFLSFRGDDTRLNFTNHLHTALVVAGFKTFYDDEEIPTGELLKPKLISAIEKSRASVIVLSENYATSSWCLDELVLILEKKRNFNQIVIPVFYHVEPTHIRKQQGSFGKAMEQHKLKMEMHTNPEEKRRLSEKMEIWKDALTEVSNLKGKTAHGRLETKLIKEIVNDLYNELGVPLGTTVPLLVGMDHNIERVTSWLKDGSSQTADILTILGVGGIGKTSLAKYVYELHHRDFTNRSFVGDISRRHAEKFKGLLKLQNQLYNDISRRNVKLTQVHDVSGYTSMICKELAREKVLLVLDDVDSLDQLDALLGNKGFHPGSKIIITTKDASLTKRCALFNPRVQPKHVEVLLEGLCKTESLELLCIHAFKSKNPKEGYTKVLEDIVRYCDGHPLALEVLGRSLDKRDVAYWEDCLKGLKKEPHSRVQNALKTSFDALPSKNDKDLFKHIACYFVGTDRYMTETIMNACDINTKSGIMNLNDRFLLSIGTKNELMMHQLVQEMGRDLVRQESPDKPWERSRLCCHKESFEVLKQKKGTENIIGLAFDMRMLEKEHLSGSLQLKTDALNKMDNLKLLQLNYVQLNGSYKNISNELRWLCMHGFHFKSIPSELPMESLVVLDMSHSNIESFNMSYSKSQLFINKLKGLTGSSSKDKRLLGSLKILDLSFCEQLQSLHGFVALPVLERLIIANCTSLIEVSESIEHCVELVFIDMSNCKKLKKLPRTIGMLKKVKTILSNGCDLSVFPMETRDMESLQIIKADNIGINSKTSSNSSVVVEVIPRDLRAFFSYLPTSLVELSLINNNLSNDCFPADFSGLSMLKKLYLDHNPIVSMPSCVRTLPRIEKLSMSECDELKRLEHPPSSLKELNVGYFSQLHKLRLNPNMSPLSFSMFNTEDRSILIEGIIKVQPLKHVEDEVFKSLGWADFELTQYPFQKQNFGNQMYYEFGIFSTIYEAEQMPECITFRSEEPSIWFAIPSSPNKLRGLNICFVQKNLRGRGSLPMIIVSNMTKNHTWIYHHFNYTDFVSEYLIFLSHWMFGKNEMEGGDLISIVIRKKDMNKEDVSIWKCGVGCVFDDGIVKQDVLGYYKSWNHIIGGDLASFQTTTGEYILWHAFFTPSFKFEMIPYFNTFVAESARSKEKIKFSQHEKSDLVVHLRNKRESRDRDREWTQFRSAKVKMMKSLKIQISILEFIYNIFKYSKIKTRSHLCFSSKLYVHTRFLQLIYFSSWSQLTVTQIFVLL